MLPLSTTILVSILGLLFLAFLVYVSSSSFMSVIVVLALAGVLYVVLSRMGVIKVSITPEGALKIGFFETAPAPSSKLSVGMPIQKKEVFYVSGNDYIYNEAPAVCAAYDSELASYDQVYQAFLSGAEWCGYGWSQGGMALFPTQEATWQKLQMEASIPNKTACGRPGVNGGYFDLETKFGVNCYGIKPENMNTELPRPLPGTDELGFQKMVDKFRAMLNKIVVFPFNRNNWSLWNK